MERPTTQQTDYAAAIIAAYLKNYGTGGSGDAQQRLAFAVHAAMGGFGSIPQEYASIPVPDGVNVYPGITVGEDSMSLVLDEAAADALGVDSGDYYAGLRSDDDEDEDADDEDDPEEDVTESEIDKTVRGLTKAQIIDAYPDLGLDMEMTHAVMLSTIKEHYLPSADE